MPSRGFRTTSAILLTRPLGARFAFSWGSLFCGKGRPAIGAGCRALRMGRYLGIGIVGKDESGHLCYNFRRCRGWNQDKVHKGGVMPARSHKSRIFARGVMKLLV